mmetsp:Transcript_57931/g.70829  ORF Transcript_57931/g.70829 Transcript_57931/m.70829 type:complete len:156 (-) Transcript_57931:29-496(-)
MTGFYENGGAFVAVSFVTCIMFFKMLYTNCKAKPGRKYSPEDVDTFYNGVKPKERSYDEFTVGDRWYNIQQNDYENVIWGLFVFWGNAIIGGSLGSIAAFYGSILWCILRLIHTLLYALGINGKPPLRTIIFATGLTCSSISALCLPVAAFIKYV